MAKTINEEKVRHIANLARLSLSDKEVKLFTKQLGAVLEYFEKLDEVDTEGIEPTYQVIDGLENVFREDKVGKSFSSKKALSQAKKINGDYFVADHVFSKKTSKDRKNIDRKKIDEYNAILTEVYEKGTVGHKDLFMTEDVETTAASHVLDGYIAHYSSTVVELLEKAGHKTRYKLNNDAWGHGASGENSDYGPTLNPWDKKLVAGGSSSGSAAVVSTGQVEVATGTDTGGSIRLPASFCNVTSIKPSYGGLSRYGVIAFGSSLDCPSLMSSSAKTLRKYFNKVFIKDNFDSNTKSKKRDIKAKGVKKIGIIKEFAGKGNDPEIQRTFKEAVKLIINAGYKVEEISLPNAELGVAVYYIIAPVETSSNLARYDGVRFGNGREYFGAEAKRRIMLGTFTSSEGYADKYYDKAARVRTLIINDFKRSFEKVDALISPVSSILPFKIGQMSKNPLQLYLVDLYLSAISLSGLPTIALPGGFSKENLPIGFQIVGPRWSEDSLFDLAEKYQSLTEWHKRLPNNSG
ncbi:Asp-tRNA(Asn)/Glu-tRNA(Gln) amidotransferase subunit GatA [Candidatus Woesebacteria bacterium]|nr:Asp-tRNA(Asn)/Glu-tRNA(Gln) amidotransferase subunit GatA [Candidatus Woesebacteria bacterium]